MLSVLAVIATSALHQGSKPAVGWDRGHLQFVLHNGWSVSPAGTQISLPGDMPANIDALPGNRFALVNTCGFHDHSLNVIDLATRKVISTRKFDRSWIGLARTPDGRIFTSGGLSDDPKKYEGIHATQWKDGRLVAHGGFTLPGIAPKQHFVSSMLVGARGLYVLNIQTNELLMLGFDGELLARETVGYRPYGLALSPDGATLATTIWGESKVQLLSASDLSPKATIPVQSHPSALKFLRDGRLLVTNSGTDTVSVIRGGRVVETIRTGVDPTDRIGATPVALALSPDEKRLFVANAGLNCVAVVDVSSPGRSVVKGFVPTNKYPTAVAVTTDGKKLLVGTAKGTYGANAAKNPVGAAAISRGGDDGVPFTYIGNQLAGALAIIDVPNDRLLARYTAQVLANTPVGERSFPDKSQRSAILTGALRKIKHVIYVIRENRTYDQVLGDIPKGNGAPALTLFGREITPNGHKIAEEFTLFDNLYTDGEVSQSGHQWTDAAYANDYNEKQWILSYSRHGEVESDKRLTSSPGDYLWTLARRHGLKARVFGEYVDVQEDHGSLDDPKIKADPERYGYSATFEKIFARGGRDPEKVADFLREMRVAERTGAWPSVMVMALPEDHTHGMSPGAFSPRAMVASNDLAIGQLVDAVSHSKFWKDTAIFVIQDDAQAGPDHVDSHRTVGYVVSAYTRRKAVDGTHYSTASMLRTMELMLGLPPMTQFDAHATPMYAAFTTKQDLTPFTVVTPKVDLEERNPKGTTLAARSEKLDWSDIDRADFNELNHILWEAYRPGVAYPAPVRRWRKR